MLEACIVSWLHSHFDWNWVRYVSRYQMFINVTHVQHIKKNSVTPSYRNTNQWCHLVHNSFCHFSQFISYVHHCFIYWRWRGALRGSSSTLSRPTCKRLCYSYTWKIFIFIWLQPCSYMVNASAGDFCSKTHNTIFVLSLTRHFHPQRNHTHTHTHILSLCLSLSLSLYK
jgi:hypothetical protein